MAPVDLADRAIARMQAWTVHALALGRRDTWITIEQALAFEEAADDYASLPPDATFSEKRRLRIEIPAAVTGVHASVMFHDDANWPSRLSDPSHDPAVLYVRGAFDPNCWYDPAFPRRAVAVIGSRKASEEALASALDIGAELTAENAILVSGLAAGIDTAAHTGSLSEWGDNVAVIGTGIDVCYPPENSALAEQIAGSGAVVSQFPPGQSGSKTSFPARNRIVAALADVTVVVEAAEHSGTRITMDLAAELGKPVLFWEPTMGTETWAHTWIAQHRGEDLAGAGFVGDIDELLASF